MPTLMQIRLLTILVQAFSILACLFPRVNVGEEFLLPLLFDPSSGCSPLEDALILLCVDIEGLVFCWSGFFVDSVNGFGFDIDEIVVVDGDSEAEIGGARMKGSGMVVAEIV